MKKMKYAIRMMVLFLFVFTMSMVSVSAASAKVNTWVEKNGRYYYYDANGKLAKGTKKIKGKYYYFNSKGRQRNGWIVSKNRYYYFKNSPGSSGYRLANTTVNGIKLQKNGQAVITNANKKKLQLLVKANYFAYQNGPLTLSKEQRLKNCFMKMVNGIRYRNLPHGFRYTSDWAEYYASYVLNNNYGDCYCAGSAFAYVATAVGYNNVYAVSSGGHGWCEINGLAYDPNWGRMTGNANHYFGLSRSGLTRNDPNYFRYGIYKSRIDG